MQERLVALPAPLGVRTVDDFGKWLVTAGLGTYWLVMLVRALAARAAPWYYKGITVVAYPVVVAAILLPRHEFPLGVTGLVLLVLGFVFDGLWSRTELLGRYEDLTRKAGKRHRPRHSSAQRGD